MAYIRMVRSGGLHYCANAINFLPELSDVLNLEDLTKRDNLSTETTQAARYAHRVVQVHVPVDVPVCAYKCVCRV
jgi:WASH complex subunit 7